MSVCREPPPYVDVRNTDPNYSELVLASYTRFYDIF